MFHDMFHNRQFRRCKNEKDALLDLDNAIVHVVIKAFLEREKRDICQVLSWQQQNTSIFRDLNENYSSRNLKQFDICQIQIFTK